MHNKAFSKHFLYKAQIPSRAWKKPEWQGKRPLTLWYQKFQKSRDIINLVCSLANYIKKYYRKAKKKGKEEEEEE
jgi:hypothetical protein